MAKQPSAKQLAWRRKFAELYGRKKRGSTSQSRGSNMTSKNGTKSKQGIVSWLTSVIALIIGLSPTFVEIGRAIQAPAGQKWNTLMDSMSQIYAGYSPAQNKFNPKWMIRGYAPIVAAVAFKKGTSYLAKVAPIRNLIPAFRA